VSKRKKIMIEDFFYLPPVSTTPVVHLELRISPQIFAKIWNAPNGIIRALGETDSWKKPEAKNLVTLSLQEKRRPGHSAGRRDCLWIRKGTVFKGYCNDELTWVAHAAYIGRAPVPHLAARDVQDTASRSSTLLLISYFHLWLIQLWKDCFQLL
jgi:hypothetical protein